MIKHFDQLTTRELYEILKLRQRIFILEQGVHCLDIDDVDYKSYHIFYINNNEVVAYLRCFLETSDIAHIGRVVTIHHGQGLGGKILKEGIDFCINNLNAQKIDIDAQSYAVGFYEKYGFKVISDEFILVEIPHRKMRYTVEK